jgi:hypothetical protein
MGIANTENDPASGGQTGENDLRGDALDGAERKRAVRNPDTVVRVDDEEDTLYSDGLEVENDTPPMGTNTPP